MITFTDIQPFPGTDARSTYLVLIQPESIPHLCIVHNGLYYSLTFKECEIGKDFSIYLKMLVRSHRKLLIFEMDGVQENPWAVFGKYQKLAGSGLTCIVPVRETLLAKSRAEFVFQLVPELVQAGRISHVYHLNMDKELKKNGGFTLNEYSKESIYAYIEALNERAAKGQ